MWTWMLTLSVIAVFSVVLLELFREEGGSEIRSREESFGSEPSSEGSAGAREYAAWQAMTESDLDAILREFADAADEPAPPDRVLLVPTTIPNLRMAL